jgi:hypothetical protein
MKVKSEILESLFKSHSTTLVRSFFDSCFTSHEDEFQFDDADEIFTFQHGRDYYEVKCNIQKTIAQFNKFLKLKAFI